MMAILKSRALLVLLGLVLLSVLLWFAGPYFAFASYKPLESVVARLVAGWVAVKAAFEERVEQILAEPIDLFAHVGPQLAALV